jgi:hypothetical protein
LKVLSSGSVGTWHADRGTVSHNAGKRNENVTTSMDYRLIGKRDHENIVVTTRIEEVVELLHGGY